MRLLEEMAATIAAVQSPEADGDLAFGRDDKDDGPVGWTASEEECDLMIDALHRELDGIKVASLVAIQLVSVLDVRGPESTCLVDIPSG